MSLDYRLASLQGRVERLSNALSALTAQVAALGQQLWQLASRPNSGGGSGLLPAVLPSGIAAATSYGSPASASATTLMPNATPPGFTATGGVTITLYSTYTTAITGTNVFVWYTYGIDGNPYVVVGDC
jgi:hypothetical protein